MIYGIHSNHTYYLLFPSPRPSPSPSPLNYTILLSTQISLRTSKSLNTIYFDEDDLISVKRKVDPNKGQGHDQISIGILQICGKAICKQSYLIIFSCIESGIFPTVWKMANVASSHNWDDKHNVKSYRPTSLFPILRKIFESLIYHDMYWFYIENNLISLNQSGFKQEDSCLHSFVNNTWYLSIFRSKLWSMWGIFRYFKDIWWSPA